MRRKRVAVLRPESGRAPGLHQESPHWLVAEVEPAAEVGEQRVSPEQGSGVPVPEVLVRAFRRHLRRQDRVQAESEQ